MPDPNLVSLVNGGYFRGVRFTLGAGLYLDYRLKFSATPTDWALQQGSYNPNPADPRSLRAGYWIFRADVGQAWQDNLLPGGDPVLQYWNADGQAKWPPQDWELFVFEFADPGQTLVRAKNTYGGYVWLRGSMVRCDGTIASAAQLGVEFGPISAPTQRMLNQLQAPPPPNPPPGRPPRGGEPRERR